MASLPPMRTDGSIGRPNKESTVAPANDNRKKSPTAAADDGALTPITPTVEAQFDALGEQNRKLKQEVVAAEHHLVEILDELDVVEKESEAHQAALSKAKQYGSSLEDSLSNFLAYTVQMERRCLMPALGNLGDYLSASQAFADAKLHRTVAVSKAAESLSIVPQPKRQQLLDLLVKPLSALAKDDILKARTQALPPGVEVGALPLEDAAILIGQLLRSKEELALLLADSRQRYRSSADSRGSGSSSPGRSTTDGGVLGGDAAMTASAEEIRNLRKMIDQLQGERDTLIAKASAPSSTAPRTYEELQKAHYAERENLQKKVSALETSRLEDDQQRIEVAHRFETLQNALDQSHEEKRMVQEEMFTLRAAAAGAGLDINPQGGRIGDRSSSTSVMNRQQSDAQEMHALRMEMDKLVRQHSATVTELESTIASLRVELANAESSAALAQRQQLQQLHTDNDSLRRSLADLQLRTASSPSARSRGDYAHHHESNLDSKIRAFEITIGSLTEELTAMERKILHSEDRFSKERVHLVSGYDRERLLYQEEREECDQLVLKMTNELESLVRENTALKVRLRGMQVGEANNNGSLMSQY